jgi:hypothetical protein
MPEGVGPTLDRDCQEPDQGHYKRASVDWFERRNRGAWMPSTDTHTRGLSRGSGQRLEFAQRAYRAMQDAHIHSPSS